MRYNRSADLPEETSHAPCPPRKKPFADNGFGRDGDNGTGSRPRRQAVAGHQADAGGAHRPGFAADDHRREARPGVRLLLDRRAVEEVHPSDRFAARCRGFRSRHCSPRHPGAERNRRRGRRGDAALGDTAPAHLPALGPGHRRHLGRRSGDQGRGDDRRGSAPLRLQRYAGRRRQSAARTAERPQFRIWRRGSAAGRHHRRQRNQGHPVEPRHFHRQALRGQRPGNRPVAARRQDLRCGGQNLGPDGVSDRHRDRPTGLGHVLVQYRQRKAFV